MCHFQDWFSTLPFFTRYWFGATVVFTLLGRFGLLAANWLVLAWYPLIHQFQVGLNRVNDVTEFLNLFGLPRNVYLTTLKWNGLVS